MDDPGLTWGPVRLGEDAQQVLDADEEVFLLYSDLNTRESDAKPRGLGHVDSQSNILTVDIELIPPARVSDGVGRRSKRDKLPQPKARTISLQVAQDITAFRSRDGDTGSVVWRASIDFAQLILQQLHFSRQDESFFMKDRLGDMNVLELGAGTGILGLGLHSWFKKYIMTDSASMLHILGKNISLNGSSSNISVSEVDWTTLLSTPVHLRSRAFDFPPLDLIMSVDCVYHPSLMPAYVEALDYLSTPGRTVVVVVIELRDEEAITVLLEIWLRKGTWEIWRYGRQNGLGRPYVIWVARKRPA